jgi:hypothetical protein
MMNGNTPSVRGVQDSALPPGVRQHNLSDFSALRREIHEGLNVVENWNSANDFILFGNAGDRATNRRDEQETIMLALHLLQNTVVYINTMMIQRVLSEKAWATRLTPEDFRALTPLIYGHISLHGTFRLDMKRRLDLELPSDAFTAQGRARRVSVPQGKRRGDPQLALFNAML